MSNSYEELVLATARTSIVDRIAQRAYDHSDARALVTQLYDDQVVRYGYADPVEADPDLYRPPRGLFLVGYYDRRPVCCGGFRGYRPGIVEIKKMYTIPELRGRGLGVAIIEELERNAIAAGAQRAILETGVRNTAALGLYDQAGYRPTARYVQGRDPAINRAFVKDLTNVAVHADGRPRQPGAGLRGQG